MDSDRPCRAWGSSRELFHWLQRLHPAGPVGFSQSWKPTWIGVRRRWRLHLAVQSASESDWCECRGSEWPIFTWLRPSKFATPACLWSFPWAKSKLEVKTLPDGFLHKTYLTLTLVWDLLFQRKKLTILTEKAKLFNPWQKYKIIYKWELRCLQAYLLWVEVLLRFSHSLFEELGRDRIPKLAPVELLLSALTSYLIEFEDQMLDNLVARRIVLELQIGWVGASLN